MAKSLMATTALGRGEMETLSPHPLSIWGAQENVNIHFTKDIFPISSQNLSISWKALDGINLQKSFASLSRKDTWHHHQQQQRSAECDLMRENLMKLFILSAKTSTRAFFFQDASHTLLISSPSRKKVLISKHFYYTRGKVSWNNLPPTLHYRFYRQQLCPFLEFYGSSWP